MGRDDRLIHKAIKQDDWKQDELKDELGLKIARTSKPPCCCPSCCPSAKLKIGNSMKNIKIITGWLEQH
jgi:hypothetical protein